MLLEIQIDLSDEGKNIPNCDNKSIETLLLVPSNPELDLISHPELVSGSKKKLTKKRP